MADPPTLDLFLRGRIDAAAFRHADHVRTGFALLKAHDFPFAFHELSQGLKTMAARAGDPGAYHATITLAFLSLIAERSATGGGGTADDFLRRNPGLLDKTILHRWYSPERLASGTARRIFLLPEAAR